MDSACGKEAANMFNRRCVRCLQPPHPDGAYAPLPPYNRCPQYVKPAPPWLRAWTRVLSVVSR